MTGFKRINITRYKILVLLVFNIHVFIPRWLCSCKNDYPCVIKVNRVHNTITVYEKDEKENIADLAMLCSVVQNQLRPL